MASAEKGKVADAIRQAAQNNGASPITPSTVGPQQGETSSESDDGEVGQGHEQPKPYTQPYTGSENEGTGVATPTVGAMAIGDDGFGDGETIILDYVTIERNPKFADVSYKFPVTDVALEQQPIDLSDISDKAIAEAAKRVTSTGDVLLRKEIVKAVGNKLRAVDVGNSEVDSIHISDEDAKDALVKLVMNMQLIPSTQTVATYVGYYLVPRFMKSVSFDGWTVKSLDSALMQLRALLKEYIEGVQRSTKEAPQFTRGRCVFWDTHFPWARRCMSPSMRPTNSCEDVSTLAGSSRSSPRSASTPTAANTNLRGC